MPRRKPFSNKQKKQQLQEKRQKKREKGGRNRIGSILIAISLNMTCFFVGDVWQDSTEEKVPPEGAGPSPLHSDPELEGGGEPPDLAKLNAQPLPPELEAMIDRGGGATAAAGGRSYNPNRFCLHFEKESNEEIERRKHVAKTTPITAVSEVRSYTWPL